MSHKIIHSNIIFLHCSSKSKTQTYKTLPKPEKVNLSLQLCSYPALKTVTAYKIVEKACAS